MSLHVPVAARVEYAEIMGRYHPGYPPTHAYAGTNSERGRVGDPGHCESARSSAMSERIRATGAAMSAVPTVIEPSGPLRPPL